MSVILIKIHNGYFYKGQNQLVANSGKTKFIDARAGASYELILKQTGLAPEKILIEKRANNLLIAFEDKTQIDLVIRDFFKYEDSQLVGLDGNGDYYSYLPVVDEYEAFFSKELWLGNGGSEGAHLVQLGSYGKVTPWLLEADTAPMAGLVKPALYGLAGAGAFLLAAENWRISNTDKSSSNKTNDKKTDNKETDTVQIDAKINAKGLAVTGKSSVAGKVVVLDKFGNELGSAKTNTKGAFMLTLKQAQVHEDALKVQIKDNAGKVLGTKALTGIKGENTSISTIVDLDTATPGNQVDENAPIGSKVGITLSAKDYEKVTYSLENDAKGTFKVDANTGVITTAKKLDYETTKKYELSVKAQSADGSNYVKSVTVTVTDGNDDNISPIKDKNTAQNKVAVNAGIGSDVGVTIEANVVKGQKQAIIYQLTDNPNGLFGINPKTGQVFVAKSLVGQEGLRTIKTKAVLSDGSSQSADFKIQVGENKQTSTSKNTTTKNQSSNTSEASNSDNKQSDSTQTKTENSKTVQKNGNATKNRTNENAETDQDSEVDSSYVNPSSPVLTNSYLMKTVTNQAPDELLTNGSNQNANKMTLKDLIVTNSNTINLSKIIQGNDSTGSNQSDKNGVDGVLNPQVDGSPVQADVSNSFSDALNLLLSDTGVL